MYVAASEADLGGGHTFASDVLNALLARLPDIGHEFVILTRSSAGEISKVPLPVITLPRPNHGWVDRGARLWRKARGRPPGVSRSEVRTRNQVTDAGIDLIWCLAPGAPVRDLPYVTVVWDLQHRLQPYFPEVSVAGEWESRDNFYGRELRQAAVVITGTDEGSREIQSFYGVAADRIRLLPHPTPSFALEAITGESLPPPTLPARALGAGYLLYPAQFWPHKNHVGLLLGLRQLIDKGFPVHLVLVGSDKGNLGAVLDAVRRLDLLSVVHVMGFVTRAELVRLYHHAVAMPYVSFFGPENLPPLEAFALGCPVVAARVAGSESQLGSAAILVDPADPADIAAGVERVLVDHQLRDQLVAAGRARAQKFTSEDFVDGVVRACDDLEPMIRTWRGVDT